MKKRFKVTATFVFDADNLALAHAIAAQGKSIAIAEWTQHASQSQLAAILIVQELRPDITWDGPEEVLA